MIALEKRFHKFGLELAYNKQEEIQSISTKDKTVDKRKQKL